MIRLERVSKHYRAGRETIRAVDDVSLQVAAGEFVIITGPSGSGKTTLLNIIGGMTRPDQGRVMIDKTDILAISDARMSRLRARTIGFVFQFQSMLPALSVLDNVRLPRKFAGLEDDPDLARSLLLRAGLAERAEAFVHQLSAGQQRRVCLARALINKPPLLLCDEPTGDLDPDTEKAIMELIAAANRKGTTVLMATHNQNLVSYASRHWHLQISLRK